MTPAPKKVSAVFALLLGTACVGDQAARGKSPDDTPPEEVRATESVVETRAVYRSTDMHSPSEVVVADSLLVVLTPWERPMLRVLALHSGALVNTVAGPQGGGFLRSAAVANDTVWLADAGRLEVRAIPFDRLGTTLLWDELAVIPMPGNFIELAAVDGDGLWLTSPHGAGAYVVVDRAGGIVREIGDGEDPLDLPEGGIRPFMDMMSLHPSGDYYVAAGHWWSGVSMYDTGGAVLRRFDAVEDFSPSFLLTARVGEPTVVPGRDARVAYLKILAQAESVYALYSGQNHYPHGTSSFLGSEIHEFDYASGALTIHRLDRALASFAALAEGEREFLGVVRSGSSEIVRFALPIRSPSVQQP